MKKKNNERDPDRVDIDDILDGASSLYEIYDPKTGKVLEIVKGSFSAYLRLYDGEFYNAKLNGLRMRRIETKAAKLLYDKK